MTAKTPTKVFGTGTLKEPFWPQFTIAMSAYIILFILFMASSFLTPNVGKVDPIADTYLSWLFAIPFFLQPVSFWFFYKNLSVSFDENLRKFCNFHWLHMLISTATYVALRLIYLIGSHSSERWYHFPWNSLSYIALFLVAVLLYPVVKMTYAIMTPVRQGRPPVRRAQLKAGASMVPFWAFIFFFMLFLGVTYVIGFALAFHDQALRVDTDGKRPALLLSKPAYVDGTKDAGSTPSSIEGKNDPKTQMKSGLENSFKFYFDIGKASPKYKYSNFDKKYVPVTTHDKEVHDKGWRESVNYYEIIELVKSIVDQAGGGERIQIVLEGGTDKQDFLQGKAYASNYELSEARAQNIKAIVLRKLSETNKNWQNLEWLVTSLSNESPRQPFNLQEGELREKREELEQKLADKGLRGTVKQKAEKELGELKKQSDMKEKEQQVHLDEIDKEVQKEKEFVISLLERKDRLLQKEILEAEKKLLRIERLNKQIDRYKCEGNYTDEDARMRIVVASLRPIGDPTLHDNLSLLDYMYFTIYTITTTGFGDIVPTTAYAKLVTSLTNILEVFFFVVFFNALLSLRRVNGEQPGPTILENEMQAYKFLLQVYSAVKSFAPDFANRQPTFEDLMNKGLLCPEPESRWDLKLDSPDKLVAYGYYFTFTATDNPGTCWADSVPVDPGKSGVLSFRVDKAGVHFGNHPGSRALPSDPCIT